MNACGGCGKAIEGQHLVVGKDKFHAACFACSGCKTDLQGKAATRRNGKFVCAGRFHGLCVADHHLTRL